MESQQAVRLLDLHLWYSFDNQGKHSCPPPTLPFNADTSYHADYQRHKVQQVPQEKVNYTPRNHKYDPALIKSTYETNYKAYEISRP